MCLFHITIIGVLCSLPEAGMLWLPRWIITDRAFACADFVLKRRILDRLSIVTEIFRLQGDLVELCWFARAHFFLFFRCQRNVSSDLFVKLIVAIAYILEYIMDNVIKFHVQLYFWPSILFYLPPFFLEPVHPTI